MSCILEEESCAGTRSDQGQTMTQCILATDWSLSMRFGSDPRFSNSTNGDLKLTWLVSVVCVEKKITSWLGINSNHHLSRIVRNWTCRLHCSNVTIELDDGYNDEKPNMVWLLLIS
jgi:hypothetical protein